MSNKLKTSWPTVEAELQYAKVFEHNRDFGNGKDIDYTDVDGIYTVDLIIDDEAKADLIRAGVPEVSMGYQQFKPTEDGRWKYRAKRNHLHKHLTDKETGKPLVSGPPEVVDLNKPFIDEDGKPGYETWDPEVLIGNGTTGRVKLQIVHGRANIIQLWKIGVKDLVEYVPTGDGF